MKRLLSLLILLLVPYLAPAQCWGQAQGGRSVPIQQPRWSQQQEWNAPSAPQALIRASCDLENMGVGPKGESTPNNQGVGGTGTLIAVEGDWGLILTCGHIFPKTGYPMAKFPGGQWGHCSVVATELNETHDLALLTISAQSTNLPRPVELADDATSTGEQVWQIGYPWHTQGRVHVRTGTLLDRSPSGGEFFLYSFVPVSGDSGGGIFRQRDSKLIGVLSASIGPNPQTMNSGDGTGLAGIQRFVRKQACLKTMFPRLWAILHKQPPGQPRQPSGPATKPAPSTKMPSEPQPGPSPGPGTPGTNGKDGLNGKDGSPGPQGPAGKDAVIDYDKIAAIVASEVSKQLKQQPAQPPPTRFRIVPGKTQ